MTFGLRTAAALTIALTAVSGCRLRQPPSAAAVSPSGPCSAALAAGRERTDLDRTIARAQADARARAHEKQALERLGHLFVARARVGNDPGDYTLAEATADCLDSKYPDELATLLLRGHVLHQLHRFREAEQIARVLVAKRNFVLDYGLLGDALMEQGRLTEAASAYQTMVDLKPFYQSYTRAAHLRWLKGDIAGAAEAMRSAVQSASPREPESSAWALTRLANYELQAGRLVEAAEAVESALRHQPDYAAALLVQGKLMLARARPLEAIGVLRRAADSNPLPEYQWWLADALRSHGRADEAQVVEQQLADRGAALDPRTLSLYLATRRADPSKAIELAEEELRVRADVFTLDAHAWALSAAGRFDEARSVIARALAEGTRDARLFLHAGVIDGAAGRKREAAVWLERARMMRATLLPSESAELTRQLANH